MAQCNVNLVPGLSMLEEGLLRVWPSKTGHAFTGLDEEKSVSVERFDCSGFVTFPKPAWG